MPYFTNETLADIQEALANLNDNFEPLRERIILHAYRTERGEEFAHHGLGRRLSSMRHALQTVFDELPPDSNALPSNSSLEQSTMAIQAFTINVSGCLDNMAWIWAHEAGVRSAGGQTLTCHQVSFNSDATQLLRSLPTPFREFVETRREWMNHLKLFRDSLAHRIPLYIPPFVLTEENHQRYEELGADAKVALRNHSFDEYEQLTEEQKQLCQFWPVYKHSFFENSPQAYFHVQLIADYRTIEEWTNLLFDNLPRG